MNASSLKQVSELILLILESSFFLKPHHRCFHHHKYKCHSKNFRCHREFKNILEAVAQLDITLYSPQPSCHISHFIPICFILFDFYQMGHNELYVIQCEQLSRLFLGYINVGRYCYRVLKCFLAQRNFFRRP